MDARRPESGACVVVGAAALSHDDRALSGLCHRLSGRLEVRLAHPIFRAVRPAAAGREMTTFTVLLIGDVNHQHRAALATELRARTGALSHCGDVLDIRDQANLPAPLPG